MKKLIMCQGLSGSGKSTWAEEQRIDAFNEWVPQDPLSLMVIVVNKDRIRDELVRTGWSWSPTNEQDVIRIRNARITDGLARDHVLVISDDTNFGQKHRVALEDIARRAGAEFSIKRFDTPVAECLRRNSLRTGRARVGVEVITGMARQYGIEQPSGYPAVQTVPTVGEDGVPLPRAIICDLDGTLSLFTAKGHREPYDATLCDQDECNSVVRTLLEVYCRTQHDQIIYLSGCEDTYRPQTETFLRLHHCPPGPLHMRKAGDPRKDWVVKGELFDAHVRGKYDVRFVLNDRNQVVDYWRHLGLTCFQVAKGDF